MPIPTKFDGQLGEIENLAGCITTKLSILHRAGPKRDATELRELLEEFVNKVIATAKGDQ